MWKGWGCNEVCASASKGSYGAGFILMNNSGLSTMLIYSRALGEDGVSSSRRTNLPTVVGIANESDQVT
jgi:hypothetical protein